MSGGEAGAQLTNCDDYKLGKILPEEKYRHCGFADLDGVEPAMGDHLLDTKTPELNGGEFTSTFIYGSGNGQDHLLRADGEPHPVFIHFTRRHADFEYASRRYI